MADYCTLNQDIESINIDYMNFARTASISNPASACEILGITRSRAIMYSNVSAEMQRLIAAKSLTFVFQIPDDTFRMMLNTSSDALVSILPNLVRKSAQV